MLPRIKLLLLGWLLAMSVGGTVYAQTPNVNIAGRLVYVRRGTQNQTEVVVLSGTQQTLFDVPAGACSTVSPAGTYVALGNSRFPQVLTIHSLIDGTDILRVPWNHSWFPCMFNWASDTVLNTYLGSPDRPATPVTTSRLDVTTGNMTQPGPYAIGPIGQETDVQLPDQILSSIAWKSPTADNFAYSRCETTVDRTQGVYTSCAGYFNLVLYNQSDDHIIKVLQDTRSRAYLGDILIGLGRAWSPSGRYFAYQIESDAVTPPIGVYDLSTDRQLAVATTSDFQIGPARLYWSPDDSYIAFWTLPATATEFNAINPSNVTVYDIDTETVTIFNQIGPFNVPGSTDQIVWSPDSSSVAFVAEDNRQLITVDIATGVSSVVDSEISGLVAWAA